MSSLVLGLGINNQKRDFFGRGEERKAQSTYRAVNARVRKECQILNLFSSMMIKVSQPAVRMDKQTG